MPLSSSAFRRLRVAALTGGGLVATCLVAALLLLSFGWALLRPLAERRLTASLGRPVRIGAIGRVGGGLFHPVLAIRDVAVAEPRWAAAGDMLRLREARVRLPALPLLAGRVEPAPLLVDGLRLRLVRDAAGRGNWESPGPRRGKAGGAAPDLSHLVVRDAVVTVDDAKNRHRFTLALASDAQGFRLRGPGTIAGSAATLGVAGAAVGGAGPWPFRVVLRSAPVTLLAQGRMRAPLDLRHFTAQLQSSGHDLTDLDHVIEAGLPPSQPFRLSATVRHDGSAWFVKDLGGTLGRSSLRGDLVIRRQADDRTTLTGGFVSGGFDFDDLSSDAQLAAGRAEERRTGPRLIPSTRIDLAKLRRTDGVLHINIRRVLSAKPTVFRTLTGTLTLDHGVLTAAPLTAGMAAGTLAGSLVVRHASGTPLLLVDLRLANSRFERLFNTNGMLEGPLAGRVMLRGSGETVREAIGRGEGRVALAGHGTMTRRVALLLGADVGRGLFAGNSDRAGVRCIVADFAVHRGIARPAPLVIDTDVARADGRGSVAFATERVALQLFGKPKKNSALRLNGPIEASGTIEQPKLNPPPQTKSVGGLLKMLGKALGGHAEPLGSDADCGRLTARVLR